MKVFGFVLSAGLAFCLLFMSIPTSNVHAQGAALLEEIVVTARRREENLMEVPVSVSVLGSDLLMDPSVVDQFDLYELTPGISYDQSQDRQVARASVRGVWTRAQNPIRAKVTSFVDGVPILGQTGSLQFAGMDRVEVMRGPQSAAFGRATFSGAINYVTKNPGEEFESQVMLSASDLDRNITALSFRGPITDTLGFTLDASFDEYQGPDTWFTTEGNTLGGQSTDYVTGKLVWAPSDRFDMNVRVMTLDTDDEPGIQYQIPGAALKACTNHALGNGQMYVKGAWNCDPSPPTTGIPTNNRPESTLTPGTANYYLAQSYGVLEPGSYLNRERVQAEFNFNTDSGSSLQILASSSEDTLRRWFDADRSDVVPTFPMGMIMGVNSMANPNNIEEQFLEVKWSSPDDQRVRWTVGASVFDFDFLTNIYTQLAGVVLGLEDEANKGKAFTPVAVNADKSTNTGVYANVAWDVSDRTTLSVEARYQDDDVTNENKNTGDKFNNVTTSFSPRLAFTHAVNDNWSAYGQFSNGTNPAGVSIDFVREVIVESLAAARAGGYVTYDADTFKVFEEEKLTNLEFGMKGTVMDNRLQLAVAVYAMQWDKMIQPEGFNWYHNSWNDGTHSGGVVYAMGDTMAMGFLNTGDAELKGVELEANLRANENWGFRGAATFASAKYKESCDPRPAKDYGFTPSKTVQQGAPYDCNNVAGQDMPQQPDTTVVLSGTYSAPLGTGGDWEWSGRLGLRYTSDEWIQNDSMNLAFIPANTIWNGSLTVRNENLTLALYGNNLTDDDTPRGIQWSNDNNLTPIIRGFNVSPRIPRELGLRMTYDF